MKKILIRIYIVISILLFISLIILSVMGSKERIGYLGDFSAIEDQSYLNNYVYSIKINYYDKIFRHSDIYGVYLNTNSLPDYVKEIKMSDEFGTPFGTLVSKIKLEDKLDNVKYYLKIKPAIFVLVSLMFIISILYIIFYNSKYLNQIMIMLLFVLFLLILFNISVSLIHILIAILSILFLLVSKKIRYFFNNNELKSRYFKIIFIFLSFLLIPGIIYISFSFLFDKNNYENRNKSRAPYLIINNLNQYFINYESFFNDYLPFRNEFVKLKSLMDIFIFKNIMNKNVLLGKNKWLFSKVFYQDYFTESELEQAKNNLLNFIDELKKRNIDFVFMICPNNESIYTEYIPDYINVQDITSSDQFVEYIEKNTNIKIIYPKNELMKYKDKYQLYYKYDTHWNDIGAYIGYSALMNILSLDYDNLDSLKVLSFPISYRKNWFFNNNSDFYNNKSRMIGLHNLKYFRDDKIYYIENYLVETNYLIEKGKKDYVQYVRTKSTKKQENYPVIFILDDSYMYPMFDYVATSFSEATFRHRKNFKAIELVRDKPDIFLLETVEKTLKSVVLSDIKDYIKEISKD